jgi:hypothetical protein
VIAVVGCPIQRRATDGRPDAVAGTAALVAVAAAAAGAGVEMIGRVGEDRVGDAVLIALSRAGVGHIAMLRDPARPTPVAGDGADEDGEPLVPLEDEPAATVGAGAPPSTDGSDGAPGLVVPALQPGDVSLGLSYIREFGVVIVADPVGDDLAREAADAASFSGAALVAIVGATGAIPEAFDGATVIVAPDDDPDGAFASLVGRYAAALDAGVEPSVAFLEARAAAGWEPSAV